MADAAERDGEEEEEEEEEEEREAEVDEQQRQPPDWLPDGWIMEVHRSKAGSIYRYYTSPVSGYTFSSKLEVLNYLIAEVDESAFGTQACPEDKMLQLAEPIEGPYKWLPARWIVEIRAGGSKLEKMYKCYVDPHTGRRFFSKEEVLCYVKGGKLCNPYWSGECDTSSEDNILQQLELYPDGLPKGWIKETKFRKCKDGIRKDPYYYDPSTNYVFRTLKDVLRYLETGEISRHCYVPKGSLFELYAFENSADLPPFLSKRLEVPSTVKRRHRKELVIKKEELSIDQTLSHSGGGATSPCSAPDSELIQTYKRKASRLTTLKATKNAKTTLKTSTEAKERPLTILKPANTGVSEHAKSTHHETERHVIVKEEVESESEEVLNRLFRIPKKKRFEAAAKAKGAPKPIKKAEDKTIEILKPTDKNTSEHAKSLNSEREIRNQIEAPEPIKKAEGKTVEILKPTDMIISEHIKRLDFELETGNQIEAPKPIKKAQDKTVEIPKPTDMIMLEPAKSLDSELETGNRTVVQQEVECDNEEVGGNLSAPRECKLDSVTEQDLHEQENMNSTQGGELLMENMVCSSAEEKLHESENELLVIGEKRLSSGIGPKNACQTSRSKQKSSAPRRASNRLAGFEAVPVDKSMLGLRLCAETSSKRKRDRSQKQDAKLSGSPESTKLLKSAVPVKRARRDANKRRAVQCICH